MQRKSIEIQGIIQLIVKIGTVQVRIWLGIVENLAVNISFGNTYMDRCIKEVLSMDIKIVLIHSKTAPILEKDGDLSRISSKLSYKASSLEGQRHSTIRVAKQLEILKGTKSPMVIVTSRNELMATKRNREGQVDEQSATCVLNVRSSKTCNISDTRNKLLELPSNALIEYAGYSRHQATREDCCIRRAASILKNRSKRGSLQRIRGSVDVNGEINNCPGKMRR